MNRVILCTVVLLLLSAEVTAVAIGVNRGSIHFQEVLRGGYARAEMVVTTDSERTVSGEVLVYDAEAAPWLNFSERRFNFSRSQPARIYVEVQPPPDARIQDYRVNMSVITGQLGERGDSLMGTMTRASLGVPVFIYMTGTERVGCTVGGLTIRDTERDQPLEVELSVINKGNVRINPVVEIEVFDKFRADVLETAETQFGANVLPTINHRGSVFFPFPLQRDQYWASVHVPECNYNALQTFDVLEAGEVKDDGELIRIDVTSWSVVGDIIPIVGVFRNRGVRSVRANMRGTITKMGSDDVVKVINTDTYLVDPGATAEIETFFNPREPGQYLVTGKIFYNNKLTVEKSAILNVNGEPLKGLKLTNVLLLVLLGAIIVFLILIIRKKQRPPTHHRPLHRRVARIIPRRR